MKKTKAIIFDWGDTVMTDFPGVSGKMCDWEIVRAEPGIREALDKLSSQFYFALGTNALDSAESDIRKALARVNLDGYFEKIYCFQTISHPKPSEEFFVSIINDLDMPPENIIMVGDDFKKDVLGANKCGIYAVWYNKSGRGNKTGKLHSTINHLRELPEAVLKINANSIFCDR